MTNTDGYERTIGQTTPCGGPLKWGPVTTATPWLTDCQWCHHRVNHDTGNQALDAIARRCQQPIPIQET